MNKVIKLISLMILSISVYFIYNYTNNKTIKIITIGDNIFSHINLKTNKQTLINNKYSSKEITIKELTKSIKTTPSIKKDLLESHILYLQVGYNDILYKLSLYDNTNLNKINNEIVTNYNDLIKEIRKYYKNKIIVIGYYKTNNDNYYQNICIRKLNKYLQNNKDITYIDTYNLLYPKEKYFNNSNDYYPNKEGYKVLSNKIITETLAK